MNRRDNMLKYFNVEKNPGIDPQTVKIFDKQEAAFKCECGHEWKQVISSFNAPSKKHNCPECKDVPVSSMEGVLVKQEDYDRINNSRRANTLGILFAEDNDRFLKDAKEVLSAREYLVFSMVYGVDGQNPATTREVGDAIGVRKPRAASIVRAISKKLHQLAETGEYTTHEFGVDKSIARQEAAYIGRMFKNSTYITGHQQFHEKRIDNTPRRSKSHYRQIPRLTSNSELTKHFSKEKNNGILPEDVLLRGSSMKYVWEFDGELVSLTVQEAAKRI